MSLKAPISSKAIMSTQLPEFNRPYKIILIQGSCKVKEDPESLDKTKAL